MVCQTKLTDEDGFFKSMGFTPTKIYQLADNCCSQNKCALAFLHISESEKEFGVQTGAHLNAHPTPKHFLFIPVKRRAVPAAPHNPSKVGGNQQTDPHSK